MCVCVCVCVFEREREKEREREREREREERETSTSEKICVSRDPLFTQSCVTFQAVGMGDKYINIYIWGTSNGVLISTLDYQPFTSEFEYHWVSHSYGLLSHLCKKLTKFLHKYLHIFRYSKRAHDIDIFLLKQFIICSEWLKPFLV